MEGGFEEWQEIRPKELQAIRQQGGDRPCLIGFRACALARTRD